MWAMIFDHCVSMLGPRRCENFPNCGHVSNVHVPYVYRLGHIQLLLPITKEEDVRPTDLFSSPS